MASACNTCATGACGPIRRDQGNAVQPVVALAGNPNTGKSTVFNALTGLRQRTGNWPGKTVARAEGVYTHKAREYRLIDLPGTYSLWTDSAEEEIARDFLWFGQPDAVVAVTDATCLERNLSLVFQLCEVTRRVVLCLNLLDEAARRGIRVDERQLSMELGIPVVPTVARRGRGLGELKDVVAAVAQGERQAMPRTVRYDEETEAAIAELTPAITRACPRLHNVRWVALRVLLGDPVILEALDRGTLEPRAARPPMEAFAA